MATQRTTTRPWFRFGSMVRQPAPQVPAAEPAPPQPIPPVARPRLTPVAQPPPPPPAAPQPRAPRSPPSPTVLTPPTPSVSTSPAPSASLPASPAPTTPTVALPVTITSSVPSSPKPQVSAATSSVPSSPASKPVTTSTSSPSSPSTKASTVSSSLPPSPAPKPVVSKSSSPTPKTTTPITVTSYVPSPAQPSPRTLETPAAPPPSPITIPPSKIEPYKEHESKIPPKEEQKDVLFQKIVEKADGDTDKSSIARTGKQGVAKEVDTEGKAHRKKFYSSDAEEGSMRVTTIAGENKGAFMEVIKSPKKKGFEATSSYLLRKKGNPGGTSSDSSSSGEEVNQKMKDKKTGVMSMNSTPMSAFMNSNIQGVNNSIVYNSSCTHHDPGIHLALSAKPSNGGSHVKNRSNGYNS